MTRPNSRGWVVMENQFPREMCTNGIGFFNEVACFIRFNRWRVACEEFGKEGVDEDYSQTRADCNDREV